MKDLELTASNAEAYVKSAAGRYDIILHFELIEHLADPYTFMTSLYSLLKTDGVMFFSTPNADGLEMLASGYNDFRLLAHSIFPPMHLNAFSVSNIGHFASVNFRASASTSRKSVESMTCSGRTPKNLLE